MHTPRWEKSGIYMGVCVRVCVRVRVCACMNNIRSVATTSSHELGGKGYNNTVLILSMGRVYRETALRLKIHIE